MKKTREFSERVQSALNLPTKKEAQTYHCCRWVLGGRLAEANRAVMFFFGAKSSLRRESKNR
jgi:hypothetical protein